jgi:predicted aminopeptidase
VRVEYAALKVQWGGSAGYDAWFAQGPTNASLAAAALYSRKVPEFRALYIAEGSNLPRFYARVQELARMPKEQRNRELAAAGMPPAPGKAARVAP